MASYCCFQKPRQPSNMPVLQINHGGELISLQGMLGLLGRPGVGVVVIQGIGGSGKTWAAKALYRAAKTSNLFDEYIWVSLSINCSMRKCSNKIAASLSCKTRDGLSVESTRTIIKEYLTPRKFLLVLDNAYFTEESILEYLGVPDPRQQRLGSKIFVTTRTVRARSVMLPNIEIMPQPLTYEESCDLLREKIGKDISFTHDLIGYCYGIPLIIILLAGALYDAPTEETFSELVANAHAALSTKTSIFNRMECVVKFGYHQLPSDNVRHCLLYCLIFPDDQGISVKELIWYWMMDGLLQEAIGFDEANHIGKEILDVLIKHGMVYLDDNDHVHMHNVIRETVSRFGKDMGYKEQSYQYFDNPIKAIIKLEHLSKYSNRVSLMDTEVEYLRGSPNCLLISSLLLRGNYLLKAISEEFFNQMAGTLQMLDLSFTRNEVLPHSISYLIRLRMLLLIGCDHLQEIRYIAPLARLEVLDASGCSSLKSVESGSFDRMVFLKVLDLSATSITSLTSIPVSMELRHINLQGCPFLGSEAPYGVSKGGGIRNLQLGSIEDLAAWMGMLWLPCGLTFQLSDRFGMKVSLDANRDSNSYVYASDTYFFKCLGEDSPLWYNCFQKFQIVISPSMDSETMDTDGQVRNTDSIFENSYFRAKHFTYSTDPTRYLEINGTVGVPSDLDGILCHAELILLKRLVMITRFSDLIVRSMAAVRELWLENCDHLESLLSADEVQALSTVGNLSSLCKGVEDVTSFSCLRHLLLYCCPKLLYLFPSALRLPNLKTLHIRFCDVLKRVFDSSVLGEDTLPRLQSLQLWELPELTCVCGGVLPSLKNLKVRGCAKLRKIPVSVNENSPFVTTTGEQLWWDSLLWDDETIKCWLLFRNWGPLLPHLATEG
ncbi:hypothetical protein C2845_PM08G28280 [Panicum miliaceum]|uniref:Uncharacterized protein n=1 Tax=Panicum miliaceum TaxID=4540 RepID=A0A3L6QXQ1_PANMI|nr:hypothetical protein C2845_PM08G28280 [Panicum miliaceum]